MAARLVLLLLFALPCLAQQVTLTGTLQGANGVPFRNGIITLQPTQSFFIPGSNSTQPINDIYGSTAPTPGSACAISGQFFTVTSTQALSQCQFGVWVFVNGGTVTWPAAGDLLLSNGTNSPTGLAPVNGACVVGAGGAWTVGSCGGPGGSGVYVNNTFLTNANFTNSSGPGQIDFSNPSGSIVNAVVHNPTWTLNGSSCGLGGVCTIPVGITSITWNIPNFLTATPATITAAGGQTFAYTPGLSNFAWGPGNFAPGITGNNNIAFGMGSASSLSTGNNNTAIGASALPQVTTGTGNTAVGYQSLGDLVSGGNDVAVGQQALALTTASGNTGIGTSALNGDTTGNDNTAVGDLAGQANVDGSQNVYLGYQANLTAAHYSNDICIGYQCDNSASNQTVLGNSSITSAVIYGAPQFPAIAASGSTDCGQIDTAGHLTSTGQPCTNVAINGATPGLTSLNITGSIPVTCKDTSGSGTAQSCTTTPSFTPQAGNCITYLTTTANTGASLTLNVNGVGAVNVFKWAGTTSGLSVGDIPANQPIPMCWGAAGWNAMVIGNAPTGSIGSIAWSLPPYMVASPATLAGSGTQGFGFLSTGAGVTNFAFGPSTFTSSITGGANVAFGFGALTPLTSGNDNGAFGFQVMNNLTTASANTGVGSFALQDIVTGNDNTAVGFDALQLLNGAGSNSAFGAGALALATTGAQNTGLGDVALGGTTTGTDNVGVGAGAGSGNTTGSLNTYLGYNAGLGAAGFSDDLCLGHECTVTASHQAIIGTGTTTLFKAYGAPQFPAIAASGSTSCTQIDTSGNVTATGSPCPTGSGGINTQTSSYTLTAVDAGKLVVMNCSSACTVTLYGSPTSTYYAGIESIGTTTATVSLNSKSFNGSTSVPVLNRWQFWGFSSDGSNYFGGAPITAGSNIVITPASNGFQINVGGTVAGDLNGNILTPTVNQIAGAAIPTSANVLGTNGAKQLVAASSSAIQSAIGAGVYASAPINGSVVTSSFSIAAAAAIQANCSTACTGTLPSSVTTGFQATVDNVGTANVTIASGGPTYDGVTTVPPGVTLSVWTDGTSYHSNQPITTFTNLSFTPSKTGNALAFPSAVPNGTTATTQAAQSNDTKVATDAYVDSSGVHTVVDTTSTVTVTTTLASEIHFNENPTATQAVTYNLPTAAAGKQFCFSNAYNGSAANTGTLTLQTSAAGQLIIYTDGTLSASDGYVISNGAAADAACVAGVDSTHWMLYVQRGTWTKH